MSRKRPWYHVIARDTWNLPCMLPPEIVHPGPVLPPRPVRSSDRRSTTDKTGQATRARILRAILKIHGAVCHLCSGPIDLELRYPHPMSATRDHVIPRSLGGTNAIRNQRPAHKVCNERRGNKSLEDKS